MVKLIDKILDSKVAKKGMIPLGNAIIKGAKKTTNYIGGQIKKDNESREYESKKSQQEYEDDKTRVYRSGRSTSTGYMPKRG